MNQHRDERYDVIIIGGGPAGMTAGLYASRAKMKTLLLEKMGCGGQSVITDWIENYPGFPEGTSGCELAAKMEEQARRFGLEIKLDEVTDVRSPFRGDVIVRTAETEYRSLSLIIASGAKHRTLDIPGETELRGKGVSYCATCDGPFFRNKEVVVVGGGNSAVQEALFLTRFASSVTLVHRRDRLRATKVLQERAEADPKIKFVWNRVVERILGEERVEGIVVRNVHDASAETLKTDGVFVFVGITPHSDYAKGLVDMDGSGYIVTGQNMETSVPGIFACGDIRQKLLRQVVTAVGDGATAAFAAQEFVEDLRGTAYK
jgi:thioredoxin-disulfide reductase